MIIPAQEKNEAGRPARPPVSLPPILLHEEFEMLKSILSCPGDGSKQEPLKTGEALKADAIDLLDVHREIYVRRGRRALLTAMLTGDDTATADCVRDMVELPAGLNPKLFGAIPMALVRAGIIEAAGFVKTGRSIGHARPVTLWTLVDREAAEKWLRDNQDLSDPADDYPPAGTQRDFFNDQETATPATVGTAAGALCNMESVTQ